jgi:predicted transcriptional regulator
MARKLKLTVYLEPDTLKALESFAADRRKSMSLVAEAAILSFLTPGDSDRREAAIAKRLDRIGRILERLERNDGIALETLALFIRHWLTATPALPENDSAAAKAKGAERYERFVHALGRRLATNSFADDVETLDASPHSAAA